MKNSPSLALFELEIRSNYAAGSESSPSDMETGWSQLESSLLISWSLCSQADN